MANGLLITMPNKQAHAALSILKQSRILAPDVTEVGAIKHVMKLIANSLSVAKIAPAKVAWEARPGKSASLHRQSMRTNPELNQCPEPGYAHRQLIVRLTMNFARELSVSWPCTACCNVQSNDEFDKHLQLSCGTSNTCWKGGTEIELRRRSWENVQSLPDLVMLASKLSTKA